MMQSVAAGVIDKDFAYDFLQPPNRGTVAWIYSILYTVGHEQFLTHECIRLS